MASRARTQQQDEKEEPAPWEAPPVEGEQDVAGREVEPAEDVVLPADLQNAMQSLMDWCVEYAELHAADNADAMAAEVARILAGEDAETVLSESAPLAGKDHTEKPFLLHSFTLHPSDHTDGWPFYAAMECSTPGHGISFTMNCGGPKVIAALKRLDDIGEYPYAIKVRGKPTRAGRTVLQLVMAGAD